MQHDSFGDPKAQAPTPKQTPTSVVFPSPVLETPKNSRASFEDSSGWTPRFAEEYSVFNATPGNLSGDQFLDFSVTNPYQPSAGHKRPLSAENIAAEIATHVNHFSPNPNLSLPPVDPSRRLPSSPGPLTTSYSQSELGPSDFQERAGKKVRHGTLEEEEEDQGQTATPPPSARKAERKLAPKLQAETMQNDQGYGQEFVAGTPQQNHMANFVTSPTDMFGFPMSAPAAGPDFSWTMDSSLSAMDIDFSAASSAMFHSNHHRPMNSIDWGRSNEIFQEANLQPMQSQENHQSAKRERALAPRPSLSNIETGSQDASMFGPSFTTPVDESFNMMAQGAGVNPGLLFTQQPPASMEPATYNPMAQVPLIQPASQPEHSRISAKPGKGTARRLASAKDVKKGKNLEQVAATLPTKTGGRPGLTRSVSDGRARKGVHRASTLPTLAPAAKPVAQQQSKNGSTFHGQRPNGRSSPLKNNSHSRLSSLTSIPETKGPKTKVRFTIDSRGYARAEPTMAVDDVEEPAPQHVRSRHEARASSRSRSYDYSDDESSTDEEPIVIPSRNTSFALPDPRKSTAPLHLFHPSQRSLSQQSGSSSLGVYYNDAATNNDGESEAETVMNEPENGRGDAASELRKVVEDRQKRTLNTSQRIVSSGLQSGSSTISPTSATEISLPTPSSRGGNTTRCVCNKTQSPKGSDGYMVQCESCEMWLHGKCINITRRTLPQVYICAFCANTPKRNIGPGRGSAASPLAHKSFRSFR